MNLALEIGKNLPEPVKKILRPLYNKLDPPISLDKIMVKDLSEYFDLTQEETICMLKLGKRLNRDLWNILNPKTEKEIEEFYQITPYYVFDLAYWHAQRNQRSFRREIVKACRGNVLDYGGGIGDLCIELAKKGLNVTYADVNGETFKFAEWIFKRRHYKIKMIDLKKEDLKEKYDTILCIDVIEHVINPQMTLKRLAEHLRKNGRLIITNLDLHKKSKMYPMHLDSDLDTKKLLNSFGLLETKNDWLWIKP